MSTSIQDLICAIKNEDVDLVCEYVSSVEGELDINKVYVRDGCWDGRTPLFWAVEYNRGTAIVELLLAKAAATEIEDVYGRTPLMIAAKRPECVEHLKGLLKHGAKVNHCDQMKYTALHIACRYANVDAIRILLEYGADVHTRTKDGFTPLQIAAQAINHENATRCLQVLLDHGADILTRDVYGCTDRRSKKPNEIDGTTKVDELPRR